MGLKEFVASIEAEGARKLCAVWGEAEQEAARAYAEHAASLAEAERTHGMSAAASAGRQAGQMRSRILNEARRAGLEADFALSERMLHIATGSVAHGLRAGGYSLRELASELPAGCAWDVVRVHPDDAAEAAGLFSGSRIETDAGIAGGLIAKSLEMGLVVDNTLETRIRRAWPGIAGALIRRAASMAGD